MYFYEILKNDETVSLPSSIYIERTTLFFLITARTFSCYLYLDLPVFLRICTVIFARKRKTLMKNSKEFAY